MPPLNLERLRPMTWDDVEQVLAWRNHDSVRKYMYGQQSITLEDHRKWFERTSADPARHLLILERPGPAGFVNLHETGDGGIMDWGFYVAPGTARGTGQALAHAALRYAFTEAGAHKMCGQVLAYNERSIRFHQRQNFTLEGVLREQHFDGVQYHDVHCFGLLEREWRARS